MKVLTVSNWERCQHYKGRRPPWIKLYAELIEYDVDLAYSLLPDVSKALLHHLWLLASRCDNRIPLPLVTKERLNLQVKPNLDPLIESGFLKIEDFDPLASTDASNVASRVASTGASTGASTDASASLLRAPSRGAHAHSEFSESKSSLSGKELTEAFESIWKIYPARDGRKAAEKHFDASVRTAADLAAIHQALTNYKRHLAATPWKAPKNGSTWFNNWRDWVEWKEPDVGSLSSPAGEPLRGKYDDFQPPDD